MCVVYVEGVEERSIYTSGGRFRPNAYMEGDQETWQLVLLEVHLDGMPSKFGRPRESAAPLVDLP